MQVKETSIDIDDELVEDKDDGHDASSEKPADDKDENSA